ncbi:hypothetical protein [Streptomyces sp. PT12]|uniref:hypothetical protein n=1 Tax=Streptomyces sp. PT12 TaxID=1510197 RepID=UPI000DE31541|nr:hypothetical protein [Streptomyces sp. PT12]RBM12150.1 hypothetical protein DEH69_20335 [Streptomyces sp. PT12]
MLSRASEAWAYARESARALTEWHIGRDPGEGEPARTWRLATDLLALAAWRVAGDLGLPVEDVPLAAVAGRLGDARVEGLLTRGHPPADVPGPPPGWRGILRRGPMLARAARAVVERHLAAAVEDDVADETNGGAPGMPPALWGDRVRAVRSAGLPGTVPAWREAAELTLDQLADIGSRHAARHWAPGSAERFAAAQLATLVPALGTSGTGGGWLPRLRGLAGAEASLTAVTRQHPPGVGAFGPRLGRALVSAQAALHPAVTLAGELDRVWARRPAAQSVARWERQHLPRPLRTQVAGLEDMVAAVEALMRRIAGST